MVSFQILSSKISSFRHITSINKCKGSSEKFCLVDFYTTMLCNSNMLLCFFLRYSSTFLQSIFLDSTISLQNSSYKRYPYLSTCLLFLKCNSISLSTIKTGSRESFSMSLIAIFVSLI